MIYGTAVSDTKIVVAAADGVLELAAFHRQPDNRKQSSVLMTRRQLESDASYRDFICFPHTIEFASIGNLKAYCEDRDVELVDRDRLVELQRELIVQACASEQNFSTVAREPTMAERLGLASNDPWADKARAAHDRREQQTQQLRESESSQRHNAMIHAAEKVVRQTGSLKSSHFVLFHVEEQLLDGEPLPQTVAYFGVKKRFIDPIDKAEMCTARLLSGLPETSVALRDGVYLFENTDVATVTSDLLERGYFHDPAIHAVFERGRIQTSETSSRPLSADLGNRFYRIDIADVALERLQLHWTNAEWVYADSAAGYGNEGSGSWYAFSQETRASAFRKRLMGHGLVVSAVRVVDAENIAIAAENGESPRPWNDGAAAYAAMTDKEREDVRQSYRGAEFLYARIRASEQPSISVIIAPKSFFDTNEGLFTEPLQIEHMLPSYLKEVEPGVYTTRSADWSTLDNELSGTQRKFASSLAFQAFANHF